MVVRGGYGLSYYPQSLGSNSLMKNDPFFPSYSRVSAANTGGVPTVLIKDGFPVPVVSNVVPNPAELEGSFNAVDVNFRATRYHQYNVQLEKELAGNVISVGYVGQQSSFEIGGNNGPDINLAPPGPGPVQPRRLLASKFPNVTDVLWRSSDYESSYDAAQFVFQRRMQRGLSLTTHYTRSWATKTVPPPGAVLDPTSLEPLKETAENTNSRPHAWVLQVNYMLPWGRESSNGVVRNLLGGWQVNTSTVWQAGRAYGVSNATERANTGGGDRPNQIGDPVLPSDERTVDRWFNTAAFQAQPQFTFGNAPNFIDYGPPQRRLDLSFFKEFGLGSARRLQFRYEIYNVTNTPSFNNPASALGNANFGRITSTVGVPRQMQFALKYLF
jgi:hypothetical protein